MAESSENPLKTPWEKEKFVHNEKSLLFPKYFLKTCNADTPKKPITKKQMNKCMAEI